MSPSGYPLYIGGYDFSDLLDNDMQRFAHAVYASKGRFVVAILNANAGYHAAEALMR